MGTLKVGLNVFDGLGCFGCLRCQVDAHGLQRHHLAFDLGQQPIQRFQKVVDGLGDFGHFVRALYRKILGKVALAYRHQAALHCLHSSRDRSAEQESNQDDDDKNGTRYRHGHEQTLVSNLAGLFVDDDSLTLNGIGDSSECFCQPVDQSNQIIDTLVDVLQVEFRSDAVIRIELANCRAV